MKTSSFTTKRANIEFLKSAMENNLKYNVSLEYDGNYFYYFHAENGEQFDYFKLYINKEVYSAICFLINGETITESNLTSMWYFNYLPLKSESFVFEKMSYRRLVMNTILRKRESVSMKFAY